MSIPCLHSRDGLHQRAVEIDPRLGKELRQLPGPSLDADVVEDVQERVHVLGLEAPADIPGGGRIGDAAGAQGVEEDLVVVGPSIRSITCEVTAHAVTS
jgi:hypothetical protein